MLQHVYRNCSRENNSRNKMRDVQTIGNQVSHRHDRSEGWEKSLYENMPLNITIKHKIALPQYFVLFALLNFFS